MFETTKKQIITRYYTARLATNLKKNAYFFRYLYLVNIKLRSFASIKQL